MPVASINLRAEENRLNLDFNYRFGGSGDWESVKEVVPISARIFSSKSSLQTYNDVPG